MPANVSPATNAMELRESARRRVLASPWLPLALAVACVLGGTALIVHTYSVFSQTFDEPAHLACGMEWLDRGTYNFEALHPPLARVAAAMLPYLAGERSQGLDLFWFEGNAILDHGGHYQQTLTLARLGILPFFWLTCFLVWRYMARAFSRWHAALAVFFVAFCPLVLGHSGVAATDAPLMTMFLAALLAWQALLQNPARRTAVIAGALTGLASLSKFTALPFLACSGGMLFVYYWITQKRFPVGWKTLLLVPSFWALTIWAGYRFSHGPIVLPGLLTPEQQAGFAELSPRQRAFLQFPYVPANEFFRGLKEARYHGVHGRDSYLLGQVFEGGRWYFFPVAILVKTPIPLLLLSLGGMLSLLLSRISRHDRRTAFLLAGAVGPLLVAIAGNMDIGLRHILPIYPFLAMLAAVAAMKLWNVGMPRPSRPNLARGWAARTVLILLLLWSLATCLRAAPDFLAYFNEPAAPHASDILVESDVDWGQDLNRLQAKLIERHAAVVWINYFGFADLSRRLTPAQLHLLTPGDRPLGWVAISEAKLRKEPRHFGWLTNYPYERVGKSIRLYHLTSTQ